jgi:parallel beta-helix repeat protein
MPTILSDDPNVITERVRGANGQAENLFVVETYNGTDRFVIDKDGNMTFPGNLAALAIVGALTVGTTAAITGASTMNRVLITNTAAGSIPLTIFGASGQTADLLSVKQNGGTVVLNVDKDGNLMQPLGSAGLNASYIIYKSGSTYYAKKETTGVILSSNASAAIVIQATLDAIAAVGGGKILFKAGIYDIDTGLTYSVSHLTMQGEQINTTIGSVLRKTAAIDLLTITSASRKIGYQFDSLYFDGNSRAYPGKLLSITKTTQRLHITNCSFVNNDGQAIYLDGVWGHGPTIRNCFVFGCGGAGLASIEFANDSNAISIRDCGIAPGVYTGILVGIDTGNLDIDHCVFENDPGSILPHIDIDGMWTTVRGCQFSTNDDLVVVDATGMYPTIVDCNFVNANRLGTAISSIGYPAVISGNHVYRFDKGIVIGGYDTVSNNIIVDANTGIYSTSLGMITDNRIRNSRHHGIHQYGGGDCKISGNYVTDSSYGDIGNYSGIALENTGNCLVQDNFCFDSQGTYLKTQKYGIAEIGSAYNNRIRMNDVDGGYGNQTGGILKVGVATIVENNLGHKTDNSGISIGTGAQQTIAHGLAATPTRVILWNIDVGCPPYQSAVADATNIYITGVLDMNYGWEAKVV